MHTTSHIEGAACEGGGLGGEDGKDEESEGKGGRVCASVLHVVSSRMMGEGFEPGAVRLNASGRHRGGGGLRDD